MIATFQSITLFGTGDPKLMAGGISQALVTTVLGLVVAIPLVLLHSMVAGRSKELIEILEEQSAGLIAEHSEKAPVMNPFLEGFEAIRDFFEAGGGVLWWILLVTIFMWTLIVERVWFLYFQLPGRMTTGKQALDGARRTPPPGRPSAFVMRPFRGCRWMRIAGFW